MAKSFPSAVMVHDSRVVVRTTAGFTANFIPGEELVIPSTSVGECLKHGARMIKRLRGTEQRLPIGGKITSHAAFKDLPDLEEVEEVSLDEYLAAKASADGEEVADEERAQATRNTQALSGRQNQIRGAINKLIATADPADFTEDLVPKVGSIAQLAKNARVDAASRDAVWTKMQDNGEVPDDLEERLYPNMSSEVDEDEDEDDDSDG